MITRRNRYRTQRDEMEFGLRMALDEIARLEGQLTAVAAVLDASNGTTVSLAKVREAIA